MANKTADFFRETANENYITYYSPEEFHNWSFFLWRDRPVSVKSQIGSASVNDGERSFESKKFAEKLPARTLQEPDALVQQRWKYS